jgi:cytochrome c553
MHGPGWKVFGTAAGRFRGRPVPIEEGGMTRNRNTSPTRSRFAAGLLFAAAALVAACSGCHGHYNRYAPARDQPRAMQRADRLETAAERALDNVEHRADNIID